MLYVGGENKTLGNKEKYKEKSIPWIILSPHYNH